MVRLATTAKKLETGSYQYNGLGDRISLEANGVMMYHALDLATGLMQVLADNDYTYPYGSGRIAQYSAAGADYFLTNILGSVRQAVDEDGNVFS